MKTLSDLDKNMPILVADDFSTVRRVVKNCLAQLGFKNVIEAEDAESAIEKLRSNRCELVISDWNIPHHAGPDFLTALREDEDLKSVPVLMIIAEAQKKDARKKQESAPEEFIVKPFTRDALQQKLNLLFSDEKPL